MANEDKDRAGAERAEAKAEKKSKPATGKKKDSPPAKAKQPRAKSAYQACICLQSNRGSTTGRWAAHCCPAWAVLPIEKDFALSSITIEMGKKAILKCMSRETLSFTGYNDFPGNKQHVGRKFLLCLMGDDACMQLFCDDQRQNIKEDNPDAGFGAINSKLAAAWKEVSEEDKAKYNKQNEVTTSPWPRC